MILDCPTEEEIEISVFGPGVGESIVLHAGNNEWLIVDSCLDEAGEPVATSYLKKIGVELSAVRLLVITHWHEDHYRGASKILEQCPNAEFACSSLLKEPMFLKLLFAAKAARPVDSRMGPTEFGRILKTLESRPGGKAVPKFWASEGTMVFRGTCSVEVQALSPSAYGVTSALAEMAALAPRKGDVIRRFPAVTPNGSSIVLHVKTNGIHLLLGADLEETNDQMLGWQAVLQSPVRPLHKAAAFKVPHHGSKNAHNENVWDSMLTPVPFALVTPYVRGGTELPASTDVARLCALTSNTYCTAYPPAKTASQNGSVNRTMTEIALSRRSIRAVPGQIRVRVPVAGAVSDIRVDLANGARKLP